MADQKYITDLENTIKKLLQPIKDIPFYIVIKSLYNYEVLKFDLNEKNNKEILELLVTATKIAGISARKNGIFSDRPNEAGNKIEPYVMDALNNVGLIAEKPVTSKGKIKTTGYPDLSMNDKYSRNFYIECKTYNIKTIDSNLRTFYLSPSDDPKIISDAFHIMIGYELVEDIRDDKKCYIPVKWQIHTLENILLQLKHEFNASNIDLYDKNSLLAFGDFH